VPRHLHKRLPPKHQPDITLSRPRRGIEKRRPLSIRGELLIRLAIQPRQMLLTRSFDGVFAGKDITRAGPFEPARVIIRTRSVDRHIRCCRFLLSALRFFIAAL
jgi:hypothetical protein